MLKRLTKVLVLLPIIIGANECDDECEPQEGSVVFDVLGEDMADYGVSDASEVDEDLCFEFCEDLGGMLDVFVCEATDAGFDDGTATIYCEGTYPC